MLLLWKALSIALPFLVGLTSAVPVAGSRGASNLANVEDPAYVYRCICSESES